MAIKSGQLREKEDFQAYILEMLGTKNDYKIRNSNSFDAGYGMDTELLFEFLYATQQEEMIKLEKLYKDKTHQTVLNYINNEINKKTRVVVKQNGNTMIQRN